MSTRTAVVLFAALAVVVIAVAVANAAPQPRRVAVSDAIAAADFSASIRPGTTVTVDHQCADGGGFTEYQAYRSNGKALGLQQRHGTLTFWRGRHGRVTFDGVTFRNGTRSRTIVSGWCS